MNDKLIAENLHAARKARGKTLQQLADMTGFTLPLVQQHDNGSTRIFASQLKIYATALRVRLDYFFRTEGQAAASTDGSPRKITAE